MGVHTLGYLHAIKQVTASLSLTSTPKEPLVDSVGGADECEGFRLLLAQVAT
jgi:hypothetical protein